VGRSAASLHLTLNGTGQNEHTGIRPSTERSESKLLFTATIMATSTHQRNSSLMRVNYLLILTAVCLNFFLQVQTPLHAATQLERNRSADKLPTLNSPPVAQLSAQPLSLPIDYTPRQITEEERSTTALFKSTSPSVVHITTEAVRRDFFSLDLMKIPQGSGTGFVWDKQGHIVTNFHVIREADIANVALSDHSTWPAKLVGVAPDKDLAVLRIEAPTEQLRPVAIGHSGDLEVGLKVFAIGNPFGLDQTLTTGIISALGREIESVTRRPIREMIQTDAAINPGNSGGPLLDSNGKLIGVNTAIYSPSGTYAGIGFAIPIDSVRRVIPQLITHGKMIRPGLKVELAPDSLSARLSLKGAIILNIHPGSRAEKAGLTATKRNRLGEIFIGDVITKVNETPITSADDLWLACEDYTIGDTVRLSILHKGKPTTMDIELEAVD